MGRNIFSCDVFNGSFSLKNRSSGGELLVSDSLGLKEQKGLPSSDNKDVKHHKTIVRILAVFSDMFFLLLQS